MDKKNIKKNLNRFFWVGLALLAAVLVISAVERKDASFIREVVIEVEPLEEGNALIKKDDITTSIKRSFGFQLVGTPFSQVNIERLERVLEEEPFILDADVFVDAQNKININVKQREPVLRIMSNNGMNYYLDKIGVRMPLSQHFTSRVLVATGNIPPHSPDFLERKRHQLKDLFKLAEQLRGNEFLNAQIEQIHLSNQGEFTLIPKVGNQKIIFGKYRNQDDKLKRLKIFYDEVLPYEGWRKYKSVNLKYKGQLVCEKR